MIKNYTDNNDLSIIYTKTNSRSAFANKICKGLTDISEKKDPHTSRYIQKYIKLIKLIGYGDWGNVYASCLTKTTKERKFAIKISRITNKDLEDPYTFNSSSWYEIFILKDILKPIIEMNICPNLPLFIDTFLCDKYKFIFKHKSEEFHPCIFTLTELAAGDMKQFLQSTTKLNDEELFSSLFQIMAGLHSIQIYGQILNNDIKSTNILYYNIKPGGYWKYKINKKNFYVPNLGKIFVLNDFGVSNIYNPNFQLYPNKNKQVFNLGSRFAINIKGKLSPIDSRITYTTGGQINYGHKITWISSTNQILDKSYGSTYKLDKKSGQVLLSKTTLNPMQKVFLFKKGITTNPKNRKFFEKPFYIPPFEFYDDVQDTLRTFVGGKRTTQKGYHTLYHSVSKRFQNTIVPYMGKQINSKQNIFTYDSYHILAGEFISTFFQKEHNYTIKPKSKILGYYNINNHVTSTKNTYGMGF